MKKGLQFLAFALSALMLISIFVGCGVESKLIGTWVCVDSDSGDNEVSLVFARNGEGKLIESGTEMHMTWKIENDQLSISYSVCGETNTDVFTFSLNGKELVLTAENGREVKYTKK